MKNLSSILFFSLFLIASIFAQEEHSIHKLHKMEFGNQPQQKSLFNSDGTDIIPLNKAAKEGLNTVIFGYLPYWNYSSAKSYLQYDLLTHIAAFDFEAGSDGNYDNPSYWPWTDVINAAHVKGVKIIMCVTSFTNTITHSIITDSTNKNRFFTNVKNTIQKYNLDGVNIDFEGVSTADRGTIMNTFMTDLATFIHANLPGKEVSFAGPIINWGGWSLPGLVKACDYVFVMGYDFYGNWSTQTGPSAPLNGTVTNSVVGGLTNSTYGYGGVINVSPEKLILGVPYYGNRWTTKSSAPYATITKFVGTYLYSSMYPTGLSKGIKWDNTSKTPYSVYTSDSVTWTQDWYDTDSSLGLKYDYAMSKKLKGVGMWALGQDGSRSELWNLLRKKYYVTDVVNETNPVPSKFDLSQNYPNPFNPSTVISYEVAKAGLVSLKVYDILGREVATLVNEQKNAGKYSVQFDTKLASGVYIYTLKSGEYAISKKMTILK